MSRNVESANRQSRRIDRRVSRTLHAGAEQAPRFSPRRQALTELRVQDLEADLYEI